MAVFHRQVEGAVFNTSSSEMNQDDDEKPKGTPPTKPSEDSVAGAMVRQVTILEGEAVTFQPKSLFGRAGSDEEPDASVHFRPQRFDEQIPAPKRAKRSLDFPQVSVSPPVASEAAHKKDDDSLATSRSTTPTSLGPTQDVDYSQSSTVPELPVCAREILALQAIYGKGDQLLYLPVNECSGSGFSIGRYDTNDFSVLSRYVSAHQHCVLRKCTSGDSDEIKLHAVSRSCWIEDSQKKWKVVGKGESVRLSLGQCFRLISPPKDVKSHPDIASTVVFRLLLMPVSAVDSCKRFSLIELPKVNTPPLVDAEREFEYYPVQLSALSATSNWTGSASFDLQYKKLLEEIREKGMLQTNTKGQNKTLRSYYGIVVDLHDSSDANNGLGRYLFPLTTLRALFGGRGAILEAIFYLRGEDNIEFLQKHGCKFWDKQANANGFIGYNYGLLVTFPQEKGENAINQLETKVITRLANHECSRNMVCSLLKPGEPTNQEACTASVQFSVGTEPDGKGGTKEVLDITVNQRSSDVILGLPHDVACWSVILHLVRREVYLRSGRVLAAGRIYFIIAAGGAHAYEQNMAAFEELLKRDPFLDVSPELIIETNKRIFELACDFDPAMIRVQGYNKRHPAIGIKQAL